MALLMDTHGVVLGTNFLNRYGLTVGVNPPSEEAPYGWYEFLPGEWLKREGIFDYAYGEESVAGMLEYAIGSTFGMLAQSPFSLNQVTTNLNMLDGPFRSDAGDLEPRGPAQVIGGHCNVSIADLEVVSTVDEFYFGGESDPNNKGFYCEEVNQWWCHSRVETTEQGGSLKLALAGVIVEGTQYKLTVLGDAGAATQMAGGVRCAIDAANWAAKYLAARNNVDAFTEFARPAGWNVPVDDSFESTRAGMEGLYKQTCQDARRIEVHDGSRWMLGTVSCERITYSGAVRDTIKAQVSGTGWSMAGNSRVPNGLPPAGMH